MWVGYGPLYLARDLGMFKKYGLDVELSATDDVLAETALVSSGVMSGVATEVDTMMSTRKTLCTKGVVALDDSAGADGILARDDITALSQMKGKEIGVSETGLPNIFFTYALEKAGLTRDDVTILNMKPEDAAAAFIAGRIPVAVTYEPSLTFVADAHKGHVLFDSAQAPGLIADLVYLRCDVIEKQPDDIRALVKGLYDAVDYVAANPDKAYDVMRKSVGGYLGTTEDFAKAAKGVTYYGRDLDRSYLGTADKPGQVMDTVRFIYKVWGPILPDYSYSDLFDPEFLPP
jgi:NitT/TauT family transport system substrate-binding protein